MQIHKINTLPQKPQNLQPPAFTGYDARPLKYILTRAIEKNDSFLNTAEELSDIGRKSGFEVLMQTPERIIKSGFQKLADAVKFPVETMYQWTQDYFACISKDTVLGYSRINKTNESIGAYLGRALKIDDRKIQGGNYFIIKENENENALLIGNDLLLKSSPGELCDIFGVKNIYNISQPDYHIDLAIRPLKDKIVLVADDELTYKNISAASKKAREILINNPEDSGVNYAKYWLENIVDMMEVVNYKNPFTRTDKICDELKMFGFKPVKVPGRICSEVKSSEGRKLFNYTLNYMNAIVHEKSDGDLVYITNKSILDEFCGITPRVKNKLNFSFEQMFEDSVKNYVKPENIYYISSDGYIPTLLEKDCHGGIHCLIAEVPE